MATAAPRPELIAIVGLTASNKSALALKIAKKYNGEIIAADSRTIYKGMDIGTAKPTSNDQQKVPHWGLDLVEPGQRYSAFEFKEYAQAKIKEIQNRGKLPILVGGTGLYVDVVLFDFGFRTPPDPKLRAELEKLSVEELQGIIHEQGLPMAKNAQNPRHLIRIIETGGQIHHRKTRLKPGVLLIGLMPPDEILKASIAKRAESMASQGLIEETSKLIQAYGQKILAGTAGIAYKAAIKLIRGEINDDQAVKLMKRSEWQYARRQKTYFKRNPHIHWFADPNTASEYISRMLKVQP
ncbi:MAG TPA: tRNA (adenosine(37)-N6)-dimethylallyltransferase MiaA [Candidatus Saccharimonadales bacterium]